MVEGECDSFATHGLCTKGEEMSFLEPLTEYEVKKLLNCAQIVSCGAKIKEQDSWAVKDALEREGFEIIFVDISEAIGEKLADPFEILRQAVIQKVTELFTENFECNFKKILQYLFGTNRKFAFLFNLPVDRPCQDSDPAYWFLFQIFKNGAGFSGLKKQRCIAVILCYRGERPPYNQTYSNPLNECAYFERDK